ncbi:MAG: hypothetical protein K2L30_01225 [Duncaniella sp.]|nr:hypothetical protein [Duncaniella sp.]
MNLKHLYLLLAGMMVMLFSACSADDHDLPAPDVTVDDLAEGISFSVTRDADNPNIVYLKSLLPSSYQVVWEHPMGRTQAAECTLRMPFDGNYEVKFGVNTRGGYVWSNPVAFTIEDFCADFVAGEAWEFLAGGAGNSKTWVPDNGNYGMKQGFYSCFDPSTVHADMINNNGNWTTESKTWWEPANGDVGITDADLIGEMTFSLQGKAGVSVKFENGISPAVQEGIFNFDSDGYTMSIDGAQLLHALWADDKSEDWSKGLQVLVLTKDQLMIGNYRSEALSGEGRCIYCWNFVSKEYADSYVPPVVTEEPTPTPPDGWKNALENQVAYCSWNLDADVPFDWFTLDGTRKNGYAAPGDYPSAYTPVEFDDPLKLKLATLSREMFTLTTPAGSVEGTYSITDDGFIKFDTSLGATLIAGDKMFFQTDTDNALRVLTYDTDDLGRISDLWVGVKETDFSGKGVQYVGYHFVADFGGSEGPTAYKVGLGYNNTSDWTMIEGEYVYVTTPGTYTLTVSGSNQALDALLWVDAFKLLKDYPNCDVVIKKILVDGKDLPFDDSAISRSEGDSPTTARRYICNAWGLASCFPSTEVFLFNDKIEVTVDIIFDNGKPFITEE